MGSIVILVIAILLVRDTDGFIHLFVSSSIVLISGLKFKCTTSDSLGEIFIPRYFMVSVEGCIGGGRAAGFQLFLERCSSDDFNQLIE